MAKIKKSVQKERIQSCIDEELTVTDTVEITIEVPQASVEVQKAEPELEDKAKVIDLCTFCCNWDCKDCDYYDYVQPEYSRDESKVTSCSGFKIYGAGIWSFLARLLLVFCGIAILAVLTLERTSLWRQMMVLPWLVLVVVLLYDIWKNLAHQIYFNRKLKKRKENDYGQS